MYTYKHMMHIVHIHHTFELHCGPGVKVVLGAAAAGDRPGREVDCRSPSESFQKSEAPNMDPKYSIPHRGKQGPEFLEPPIDVIEKPSTTVYMTEQHGQEGLETETASSGPKEVIFIQYVLSPKVNISHIFGALAGLL